MKKPALKKSGNRTNGYFLKKMFVIFCEMELSGPKIKRFQ